MIFQMMHYESPVGRLVLAARSGVLHVLAFPERWPEHWARLQRRMPGAEVERVDTLDAISPALDAYFAGGVDALRRIRAEPFGTAFQQEVWKRLPEIEAGRTRTYGELARSIGAPRASRAVGAANGANPVSVVLPCHRVIGGSGDLTGYGGGLERKRWLLAHERRFASGEASLPLF